jgi:hypothetical protein
LNGRRFVLQIIHFYPVSFTNWNLLFLTRFVCTSSQCRRPRWIPVTLGNSMSWHASPWHLIPDGSMCSSSLSTLTPKKFVYSKTFSLSFSPPWSFMTKTNKVDGSAEFGQFR